MSRSTASRPRWSTTGRRRSHPVASGREGPSRNRSTRDGTRGRPTRSAPKRSRISSTSSPRPCTAGAPSSIATGSGSCSSTGRTVRSADPTRANTIATSGSAVRQRSASRTVAASCARSDAGRAGRADADQAGHDLLDALVGAARRDRAGERRVGGPDDREPGVVRHAGAGCGGQRVLVPGVLDGFVGAPPDRRRARPECGERLPCAAESDAGIGAVPDGRGDHELHLVGHGDREVAGVDGVRRCRGSRNASATPVSAVPVMPSRSAPSAARTTQRPSAASSTWRKDSVSRAVSGCQDDDPAAVGRGPQEQVGAHRRQCHDRQHGLAHHVPVAGPVHQRVFRPHGMDPTVRTRNRMQPRGS